MSILIIDISNIRILKYNYLTASNMLKEKCKSLNDNR